MVDFLHQLSLGGWPLDAAGQKQNTWRLSGQGYLPEDLATLNASEYVLITLEVGQMLGNTMSVELRRANSLTGS